MKKETTIKRSKELQKAYSDTTKALENLFWPIKDKEWKKI